MRIVFRRPNATVFYDFGKEEFVVRFWRDGVYLPEADYVTNDRTDAVETAELYNENLRLAAIGD
jgi:hypothetical protein